MAQSQALHIFNPWLKDMGDTLKYRDKVLRTRNRVGLHKGNTENITVQEVVQVMQDNTKFIKFYFDEEEQAHSIQLFIELSLGAQRVLSHLIKTKIRFNESVIYFIVVNIAKELDISRQTVTAAVNELVERNWLARGQQKSQYFINVNLFCIGDKHEIYKKEYHNLFKVNLKGDIIHNDKREDKS